MISRKWFNIEDIDKCACQVSLLEGAYEIVFHDMATTSHLNEAGAGAKLLKEPRIEQPSGPRRQRKQIDDHIAFAKCLSWQRVAMETLHTRQLLGTSAPAGDLKPMGNQRSRNCGAKFTEAEHQHASIRSTHRRDEAPLMRSLMSGVKMQMPVKIQNTSKAVLNHSLGECGVFQSGHRYSRTEFLEVKLINPCTKREHSL